LDFSSAAQAWLEVEPDADNRRELEQLLAAGDNKGLADRFASRLSFGTAGLRAAIGAGPNRMNRVVVAQTALGLAHFLLANRASYQDSSGGLSVVVGHDARLKSAEFAQESGEILAAAGIRVRMFNQVVATPILAFTAKRLNASAAVMVTASHNPREDNGYKVYLGGTGGGSQLTPPADAEIAAAILAVAVGLAYPKIPRSTEFELLPADAISAYLNRALELEQTGVSELKICHTAMHGVGWLFLEPLLKQAGFHRVVPVTEQQNPDGQFPTLPFPNPEEPGALDLAFKTANAQGSEVILATDPDADRLAVAVLHNGAWRQLTGDEVGLLLGERIAARSSSGSMATSIVSLQVLEKIARAHGLGFASTLTGFKWISKVPGIVFGYEEALGYCIDPKFTPDKDGITAALAIAQLATELKAKGETLIDALGQLAEKYGHFASSQISVRLENQQEVSELMARLRQGLRQDTSKEFGEVRDWLESEEASRRTDALEISGDGFRVLIRPSGTEAKLKCYVQSSGATAADAQSQLETTKQLTTRLLKA
jgi:phosphomannomutase